MRAGQGEDCRSTCRAWTVGRKEEWCLGEEGGISRGFSQF